MASNVTMYAKLQRTSMTLNAAQKSSYHQCLHMLRFVLLMYGVPFDGSTLKADSKFQRLSQYGLELFVIHEAA